MGFSLFVLKYSLRENTMGWGFKDPPPKKKGTQIDFLFLEQASEQENCHVWQTAAGRFPWALVFRVSANPISHVCRLALSPPFPFNYFWLIHSPVFCCFFF